MNIEYENLQHTIKRKYSFKYKPEFTESFKTDIDDNQIIPLAITVFEKLEWPIVFQDTKTVEAKRKGDWNKLTEKITITKKTSGRIEVHSKTIEGNFVDFGKNSKRTGLFITLFEKLVIEYNASGKLTALATDYEKKNSWANYEMPSELPKPRKHKEPNLVLSILGGAIIAILFGLVIAYLSVKFTYFIGVYEVGIGIGFGYLFGQLLKATHYTDFKTTQFMVGLMMILLFLTNQYAQYHLIITENDIADANFIEFMTFRIENGLTIKSLNTGWIGLILSWIFQMVFPYFIAVARVASIIANYMIERIPDEVLEYTIYLFNIEKPESEVRAELALRGWNKKTDQDDVFQAIAEISGFQQANRE